MKLFTILLPAVILIGCNQNNISVVESYEKLHNSHDIEGAMSLYHDEIEFELAGTWIKSGKAEIRELEEWDRALNSDLEIESIKVKGDSIFCKVIERNDWFKAVGIEKIIHDPTIFIVRNKRIKKIIAIPSGEIGKEIGAKLNSIYTWSNNTNDNTISELIINGEFIYSAESAKKWLILLDNWNRNKALNQPI
jgi:hypothetical protein